MQTCLFSEATLGLVCYCNMELKGKYERQSLFIPFVSDVQVVKAVASVNKTAHRPSAQERII